MNTKTLVAVIITALVVIGIVTLHLIQPKISYALCELFVGGSFVLGGIVGYLLKDHIK